MGETKRRVTKEIRKKRRKEEGSKERRNKERRKSRQANSFWCMNTSHQDKAKQQKKENKYYFTAIFVFNSCYYLKNPPLFLP